MNRLYSFLRPLKSKPTHFNRLITFSCGATGLWLMYTMYNINKEAVAANTYLRRIVVAQEVRIDPQMST